MPCPTRDIFPALMDSQPQGQDHPGSRSSAVQEYSDFQAECKTTATFFSSDPWASGYAVTQLQQHGRCLLSKHPPYITAKIAVGYFSEVKLSTLQGKSPLNPSFLLFWSEFQCFLMLEVPLSTSEQPKPSFRRAGLEGYQLNCQKKHFSLCICD